MGLYRKLFLVFMFSQLFGPIKQALAYQMFNGNIKEGKK